MLFFLLSTGVKVKNKSGSNEQAEIELFSNTGLKYGFKVSSVAATQIKPAAKVPFSGDITDLIELLRDSFFVGGDAPAGGATEAKQDELIQKTQKRGATVVRTSVVSSISVQTLAAANANRIGLVIHNDSSERLFIAYGTGATTSDFSVRINRNSTIFIDDTTAEITAVSGGSTPTGNIFVTEITP